MYISVYIFIYVCMYEPQVREVQEMQALRERELRLESQVSADLRRRLAAADDANTALEAELASAKAALEVEVARTREALLVKGGGGGGRPRRGRPRRARRWRLTRQRRWRSVCGWRRRSMPKAADSKRTDTGFTDT